MESYIPRKTSDFTLKKFFLVCLLLIGLLLQTNLVFAGDERTLGMSVFSSIQYPERHKSIKGLRLNFFYGRHHDLTGLDIGVVAPITLNVLDGELDGLQIGSYNQVGDHSRGIQWGFINYAQKDFGGLQLSVLNITGGTVTGGQVGLINRSRTLEGIQVGIFNYAFQLKGIQIGISNLRSHPYPKSPNTAPLKFSPLINWAF